MTFRVEPLLVGVYRRVYMTEIERETDLAKAFEKAEKLGWNILRLDVYGSTQIWCRLEAYLAARRAVGECPCYVQSKVRPAIVGRALRTEVDRKFTWLNVRIKGGSADQTNELMRTWYNKSLKKRLAVKIVVSGT
jgi:hypothetical protein